MDHFYGRRDLYHCIRWNRGKASVQRRSVASAYFKSKISLNLEIFKNYVFEQWVHETDLFYIISILGENSRNKHTLHDFVPDIFRETTFVLIYRRVVFTKFYICSALISNFFLWNLYGKCSDINRNSLSVSILQRNWETDWSEIYRVILTQKLQPELYPTKEWCHLSFFF